MTRHRQGINLSAEAHTKKTSILIICNHKDEKWSTLFEERLRVFEVDDWTDRDIGISKDWREKIKDGRFPHNEAIQTASSISVWIWRHV